MAKSVAQLNDEIAKLQKQVEAAKAKEALDVIANIREAIDYYGLTPDQLFAPRRKARAVKAARPTAKETKKLRSPRAGQKLPAKYSDGKGNSWTGRGNTPRWLAAAIAEGKTKEDFAIS